MAHKSEGESLAVSCLEESGTAVELPASHDTHTLERSNVRYLVDFMDIPDETVAVRLSIQSFALEVDLDLLVQMTIVVIAGVGM